MSTAPDPIPQPGRMRLWVRILLAVSLALNLLVAGLAIGAVARFGPHGGHRSPSVGAALYRALPEADRKAVRESLMQARSGERHGRRGADMAAIIKALRAEPFDPDALDAVAGRQLAERHDGIEKVQQAWLRRVTALAPAERQAYAGRLAAMAAQEPQRRRWFGGRRD